jgi:hypothetical protein
MSMGSTVSSSQKSAMLTKAEHIHRLVVRLTSDDLRRHVHQAAHLHTYGKQMMCDQ